MTLTVFGQTQDGRDVHRVTLENGPLHIAVLTYGAVLQDVRLAGVDHSLTLGSPDLAAYEGPFNSFGSIMGPVANRLRHARAPLGDGLLQLPPNLPGGHILHSGPSGLQRRIWEIAEHTTTQLVLTTQVADKEDGFPGNRTWRAAFSLNQSGGLTLRIKARTDALTLMNTVNHSYWNLGPDQTHDGHVMRLNAASYLPCDKDLIPLGEPAPVSGTHFDFQSLTEISLAHEIDHNYCLGSGREPLRAVLELIGPTGVRLRLATTEPGLQVYDGNSIVSKGFDGLDGRQYGPRAGLALEPQFWPNAPNEPSFPSIALSPGDNWEQVTEFTFDRVGR